MTNGELATRIVNVSRGGKRIHLSREVKTFVIPIFMYRAGLICVNKDVIKEANKIIFQFIWKGKDKVLRGPAPKKRPMIFG